MLRTVMTNRAELEAIRDAYAQVVAAKREQVLGGDVAELGRLASSALEQAARHAALTPDDPELVALVRLGAQATAALFALARTRGGPVEVALGRAGIARLEGAVDPGTTHAAAWVIGAWAGAATRDLSSLVLLAVTPTSITGASPTRVDPHVDALASALKAWWTGDPATGERILAALEAADPDDPRVADPDEVLELRVPELDLLSRIAERDAAAFADALASAIALHRAYWSRDPGSPAALLPLSLTALAVMGRDAGLGEPPPAAALPAALLHAPAPGGVICCPQCVTPVADGTQACPACLQDVTRDAPVELAPGDWLALRRRACPECDAHVPAIATRCPACA
jgi:hypothetical protein